MVQNLFIINDKDTKTTSNDIILVFFCWLWTDFINCPTVSTADFDQVNSGCINGKHHYGGNSVESGGPFSQNC